MPESFKRIRYESVQPEAGQVHILGRECSVQPRQNVPHHLAVIGTNAACVAALEKPFNGLLLKLRTMPKCNTQYYAGQFARAKRSAKALRRAALKHN